MTAEAPAPEHVLHLHDVDKHFGGTQALRKASLAVRPGTVHALLGGNGSGKSTSIKILAGVYTADDGELEIGGERHDLKRWSAQDAHEAGLRFVHQDLGLFEELSIAENFGLDTGFPTSAFGNIQWSRLETEVGRVLLEYGLDVSPTRAVAELRPSDRTMVAIARALRGSSDGARRILILDEPTASLAAAESKLLLENVRRLADRGQTVVMVSHRLQEVLDVADDFTVFRDGRVVGALVDAHPTEDELIALMAGGLAVALSPTGERANTHGEAILEVSHLESGPLRDVTLTAHRGEIVGIAGLQGSGRSSLLQALFGVHHPSGGTITLGGKPYAPRDVHEAMADGVGMVPENRVREAAFMDLSVSDNLALAMLDEYFTGGRMPRERERTAAAELIDRFDVKVDGPDALFSSMSGGNQQKVIIARWLQRAPRLLLLDEPTQGVDVMSRADIYDTIRAAAADGCTVVVASSDMAELHALCDRVVILARGRLTGQVLAGETDVDGLVSLVLREPGTRRTVYEPEELSERTTTS
ncbi:sugar ABC transporter ATP-binding protein [Microbacterium gorillae]|uniref:sugar ABC transporter ATP-binding protein n=1 Tax=Microbacterium gorillae TaxID=1231063 RepID=UPI000A6FDF4B|nr:sugar ABC transporter ATP-binding protein [Microbacterium gorillae]